MPIFKSLPAQALGLAFLVASAPVFAQKNTQDPVYRQALKLEVAGNYAAALSIYESIPVGKRLPATRMHIAGCKARLGRFLAAEAELVGLLGDPTLDSAERETAQGDLDLLREKTPKLTITATPSAEGAKVTLDGQEITLPATRALDAGLHTVIATKGLKEVYHRGLTLEEGSKVVLEVDDPNAAPTPAQAAKSATAVPTMVVSKSSSTAPTLSSSWSAQKKVAVLLGAVGVAGLGAGTYLWLHASAQNGDAHDAHDKDLEATSNRTLNLSRAFLGVGLVGVGVGSFLFIDSLASAPSEGKPSAFNFRPSIDAHGASLSMGGAW